MSSPLMVAVLKLSLSDRFRVWGSRIKTSPMIPHRSTNMKRQNSYEDYRLPWDCETGGVGTYGWGMGLVYAICLLTQLPA